MPDETDMAGILLQLNLVASQAGISFDSIRPGNSTLLAGYQAIPITITFSGNYYGLVDFLQRLRNLVDVQNGELDASGRLFAIDTLNFAEGDRRLPAGQRDARRGRIRLRDGCAGQRDLRRDRDSARDDDRPSRRPADRRPRRRGTS